MVVSRKTTAAAPAPVSRTSSSQPIPKKPKQQLQEQEIVPLKKTDTDASPNKLRKPKPKVIKAKVKSTTGSTTLMDRLFFMSLFAFALYAAIVCPQHAHDVDVSQTPATCRALSSYRSHILEPYLLPPLKYAYNSDIVKPYAQQLEDVAHTVEGAVRPWYHRAFLPRWRQHVAPRIHQTVVFLEPWYHQALGLIKAPLQPYWSKIEPHYTKFLHDYQLYYTKTEAFVTPYIVQAQRFYSQIQPYVDRASDATHQALWDAWTIAKPHLITGANHASVYAKVGWRYALDARRQYVDPHIKTILDQVDGNGKNAAAAEGTDAESTEPAHAEPTEVKMNEETESIPTTVLDMPEVVESAPAASPPEAVDEVLEEVTPEATISESVVTSVTPAPTSVEAVPSPAHDDIEEDDAKVPEIKATPQGSSGLGANAQKTAEVADNLELDDFLSELGLESEIPPAAESPAPEAVPEDQVEQPVPIQEAEEDAKTKEEKRKAATAEKRQNIVARHVEWQRQLDELFDTQEKRVWVDIEGVREWAVSELGDEFAPKDVEKLAKAPGLPETRYKRAVIAKGEGLGSKAIEGINKQGGRFIRGLETYLGSLESRKSAWTDKTPEQLAQTLEKEREKWDGVVDKVEERFGKLITDVQGDVHKWYAGIRTRENEVINEAADAIRLLAERAQADIAMDYAWLDDVSTRDWANYHELMTTYEDFQKTAMAIQNGSYVPEGIFVLDPNKGPDAAANLTPPADPLVGALDKLQAEWNDVVLGFQLSVQNVKKRALEVLSVPNPENEETPEGTFRIKNEKGKRVDDMREYLEKAKERLEKEMVGMDAGKVVIGKDPVVVAENVKKAQVEERDEL